MSRTFEYRCTQCGYIREHATSAPVPPAVLQHAHRDAATGEACTNQMLRRVWGNIAIFNLVPDFSR